MVIPEPVRSKHLLSVLVALAVWALLLGFLPYSAALGLSLKVILLGALSYVLLRIPVADDSIGTVDLGTAPNVAWILLSTALLVGYALLLEGGWSGVHSMSVFYLVSAVIVSPLIEEIAFRGVLLRRLETTISFAAANLSVTALFVVYHIPLWIARGQGVSLMPSLWVAVFSLGMGYVLHKTDSLWTCIIIHSVQNLVLALLIA
jgi:membrane protease YdiL (CAAX protease family)